MPWWGWLVLASWLAGSAALALLLGATIRKREKQVPREPRPLTGAERRRGRRHKRHDAA